MPLDPMRPARTTEPPKYTATGHTTLHLEGDALQLRDTSTTGFWARIIEHVGNNTYGYTRLDDGNTSFPDGSFADLFESDGIDTIAAFEVNGCDAVPVGEKVWVEPMQFGNMGYVFRYGPSGQSGSAFLGRVQSSGNSTTPGNVACLTLNANGTIVAGTGNLNFSGNIVPGTTFPPTQLLGLLTVGSSNVPIPVTPADGTGNHGWVSNATQTFMGNKTFNGTDGSRVTVVSTLSNVTGVDARSALHVRPGTGFYDNSIIQNSGCCTVNIEKSLIVYSSSPNSNGALQYSGPSISVGQNISGNSGANSIGTTIGIHQIGNTAGDTRPAIWFTNQQIDGFSVKQAGPMIMACSTDIWLLSMSGSEATNIVLVNGAYKIVTGSTSGGQLTSTATYTGQTGNDPISNQFRGGINVGVGNLSQFETAVENALGNSATIADILSRLEDLEGDP